MNEAFKRNGVVLVSWSCSDKDVGTLFVGLRDPVSGKTAIINNFVGKEASEIRDRLLKGSDMYGLKL